MSLKLQRVTINDTVFMLLPSGMAKCPTCDQETDEVLYRLVLVPDCESTHAAADGETKRCAREEGHEGLHYTHWPLPHWLDREVFQWPTEEQD